MSWPDLMTPWQGEPAPALPLEVLILAALAGTAVSLRDGHGSCADCRDGEPCPDRLADLALAGQFDAAYMQVTAGSGAWCDLAVALAAGVN